MKIQLLLTGAEIMSGDVVDSNSAMMATMLAELGWRIERKVTVSDDLHGLVREISAMTQDCDVLIINGGLGPTVDDLTAEALAEVSGQPLKEHPQALEHLLRWCERRNYSLNASNHKQAILPDGCDIVDNLTGSAPGIKLRLHNCLIYATPGVPSELRDMMQLQIIPDLRAHYPSDEIETRRMLVFGRGESTLQELINEHYADEWPEEIDLGFRASFPTLEVKLTASGQNREKLEYWQQRLISDIFEDTYIANAPSSLAQACVEALTRQSLTVTCAESCTGGMIASRITDIPGSSAVFEAGWVTYSNSIKTGQLGVATSLLEAKGAVSREVASAMAAGAMAHSGADIAIAVSGIAGPDGGTADKPVGTVCIALNCGTQVFHYELLVAYRRDMFRNLVCAICLDLIRRAALKLELNPRYLERYRKAD